MRKKRTINWWKWSFLILLALNLAFVCVIASRVIQVREPESQKLLSKNQQSVLVGHFTTSRKSLNDSVARYLKKQEKQNLSYQIYASRTSIIFEGNYYLLGYEVPLYVYFQPIALANGNIQLRVTSISAGTLPLPEAEVLRYIKSSYKLPSFVSINSKESSLLIRLDRIDNEAGIFLKAKKIDLVNDKISFEIFKK